MSTARVTHVPPGSQDLLGGEVRRRRHVQREWFALAESRGYEEVIPPTFEFEEVFTLGAGPDLASRLIRFVDRGGRLVALRADFTSALARVAATRLATAPLPLRLCYAGKVYRQEAEGAGRQRELFQLGAELIGDGSAAADVQVLRLAMDLLRTLGIDRFQINLGDVGFVQPLLRSLLPAAVEDARRAIDRRDRAALTQAARDLAPGSAAARALAELPELIGRGAILARAAVLAVDAEAAYAVQRLQELDQILSAEERQHVVYDLAEIRGLGYYTGMRFELFVAGAGRAVGFGGRYDHLLALYGTDRPAVGFALEIDALAELAREDL